MLFPYNRSNGIRMIMANGALPKDGSNEKVAFDLMQIIAGQEAKPADKRGYYLELYAQCLRIVSGEDFDDVFDDIE